METLKLLAISCWAITIIGIAILDVRVALAMTFISTIVFGATILIEDSC